MFRRLFPIWMTGHIAASGALALTDGSLMGWGAGGPDQTGYPHFGQTVLPYPNTGFVSISVARCHNLALKEDGSIVAWGYNSDGQCDVPEPNSGFIAVAAGGGG